MVHCYEHDETELVISFDGISESFVREMRISLFRLPLAAAAVVFVSFITAERLARIMKESSWTDSGFCGSADGAGLSLILIL